MKITFLFEFIAYLGLVSSMAFGEMNVQNNTLKGNENVLSEEAKFLRTLYSDNRTVEIIEKEFSLPLQDFIPVLLNGNKEKLHKLKTLFGQMTANKDFDNSTMDHVKNFISKRLAEVSRNETKLKVGTPAAIPSPSFNESTPTPSKKNVTSQVSKAFKPIKTCKPSTSYVVLTSTVVSSKVIPFTSYESLVLQESLLTSTAHLQEIKNYTVIHVDMVTVNVEPKISTITEYLTTALVSPMTFYYDKVSYITKTELSTFYQSVLFDEFVSTVTSLSDTFVTLTKVKTKTTSTFVTETLTTSDVFVYPTTIYNHIPLTSTITKVKKFDITVKETKLEMLSTVHSKTVFETQTVKECDKEEFLKKLYKKFF